MRKSSVVDIPQAKIDADCMKEKLQEVTFLRVLAVLMLVAWHSYCTYICWGLADSPLNIFYTRLFRFLTPDAYMPVFTFISGYLFYYLMVEKRKYVDFKEFLKNKINRLLIPYIVLGFTINMTQIGRQNPLELLVGTPNHLWYCLMLFYCFIACWLIEMKLTSRYNIIAMCLSFLFVLVVGARNIIRTPLGLWMPIYYYGYFYMGFLVFKHKEKIMIVVKKYWYLLLAIYIISIIWSFNSHFLLFTTLTFTLMLYVIGTMVKNSRGGVKLLESHWSKEIEKCSFGIYVFHQWIIWNVTRYPDMSCFMSEHYILFPFLLYISVFILSYIMTKLSIQTKIGRYLLL